MFIASLAAVTKNIRLDTGTVNMTNTHPAAVAAQIAMLDHLLAEKVKPIVDTAIASPGA